MLEKATYKPQLNLMATMRRRRLELISIAGAAATMLITPTALSAPGQRR